MDGAAKNADKVAQRILPDRPHHLSLSLDRRFPKPEGWWFSGASGPLQYMTYISDAQRGVLLTRAVFNICEEPPQMAAKVLAKGEVKKKLSLMDYQNKKKSASPIERELSAKAESRANGTVHAKPLPPKEEAKKVDVKTADKTHAPRPADSRPEKPRPEPNGERSKAPQAKPQPETESRKRAADTDTNQPPQKRTKAEPSTSKTEQARSRKLESPRGREGANGRPPKDVRNDILHPATNGLASSSAERDRENTASPRSTIQVNGSRVRSDSNTSTPRKPETVKPSLPEILSPLHPSLFNKEPEKQGKPRKKPAEKMSKPQKSEGPSPTKKAKKAKIPALLSPTLPPIVEEALALRDRKQAPSKTVSSQASDSQSSARKTIVAAPPVLLEEEKPNRPSLIVTLKLKKATAKRAKELLSLPSKAEKDTLRKERSTSAEATPPPAPKKRPRPADEILPDPPTAKRARAATTTATITSTTTATAADVIISAKSAARPTTPLKPAATAMSRVTSSQSQGQGQGNTPGTTTGLTPSTVDRPPTRSEPVDPKTLAQAEAYKERHAEYQRLGSKLKHARDDLCRDQHRASSSSTTTATASTLSPQDERRAMALHFEMVLAYMVAFHSLNQARALERKVSDVAAWESLLPHLAELRTRVGANRALKALAVQMHVLCLEQIINAFSMMMGEASGANLFVRLAKHNRNRAAMWAEAAALCERVEEARMRTVVGPWMSVEEGVGAALGIMRRWAEREGVRWVPEISLRDKERDHRERDRDYRERDKDRDRDRDRDRARPLNGRA
ncbi:hypothetical protein MFIFM68171_03268 [Madurella fahalii]|uniref:Uncharacterized protein n=1 Tax=Madurella fahalii TaxID=1157608 RepID=A0ABQ0G5L5_9PEZI